MENKRKKPIFNEITSIISVAFGLLLLLSLLSYNPRGTNFFGDSSLKDTNLIGSWGNRAADGALHLTGIGAYFLIFVLFYMAYLGIANNSKQLKAYAYAALFFGFISFSALSSSIFTNASDISSGGAIGEFISGFLASQTGKIGAIIILASIFLISFLLATGVSPVRSLKRSVSLFRGIWNQIQILLAKRKIKAGYKIREGENEGRIKTISLGKKPKTKIIYSNNHSAKEFFKYHAEKRQTKQDRLNQDFQDDPEAELDYIGRRKKPVIITEKDNSFQPKVQDMQDHYITQKTAGSQKKDAGWKLPPIELLDYKPTVSQVDEDLLDENTVNILNKLKEFRIDGQISQIHPGPVVTTYEFKPAPGIKYSRVVNLVDDLCLALKAENIRIARMVGKSTIGIEVPNSSQQIIYLREVIDAPVFKTSIGKLTLALGKNIVGKNYVTDLAKMPHLLMAGTTGSGKSVSINSMICSILYNATPNEVKFIMIDPKRLELGIYDDIPHLLTPVVTDPHLAAAALMWAVHEMNERLKKLSKLSVRDIDQYNAIVRQNIKKISSKNQVEELKPIPYLVVVVDELSDLMIVSSSRVEEAITRLSQMARAVGIHLIVATQRPSVDVITGIIKANMPSRISFRVFSKIDSRVILDGQGAEKLLGRGDMLLIPPGSASQVRIHGALVSEREIEKVIAFWKKQGLPSYNDKLDEQFEAVAEAAFKKKAKMQLFDQSMDQEDDDSLYEAAKRIVVSTRKASVSNLQRKMKIGYNRAARFMDMMEEEGIVGPADGAKPRSVLVREDFLDEDQD
jgi:S-DNA-T family DNA segregation ATPase FtsK/SpoIIIE